MLVQRKRKTSPNLPNAATYLNVGFDKKLNSGNGTQHSRKISEMQLQLRHTTGITDG